MSSVITPTDLHNIFERYVRPSPPPTDFDQMLGSRLNNDVFGQFAMLACLPGEEAKKYASDKMKIYSYSDEELFGRRYYYTETCHSLVTLDLIMFLWSFMKGKRVRSVASGEGFLEEILYQMCINIQCSDVIEPECTDARKFVTSIVASHISSANPDVNLRHSSEKMPFYLRTANGMIMRYGNETDVFFMSWLEPDTTMSEEALKLAVESVTNEPKYIVLLGDYKQGGACGSYQFKNDLYDYVQSGKMEELGKIDEKNHMLCYRDYHDSCTIYRINPDNEIHVDEPQNEIHETPLPEKFVDYLKLLNQPTKDGVGEFMDSELSEVENLLLEVLCTPCLESHETVHEMAHISEEFHGDIGKVVPNFGLVVFLHRFLKGKKTLSMLSENFVTEGLLRRLGCDILKTGYYDLFIQPYKTVKKIIMSFANAFRVQNPQLGFDEKVGPVFCDCEDDELFEDSEFFNNEVDVVIMPADSDLLLCSRILMRLVAKARDTNRSIHFVLLGNYGLYGSHTSSFRRVLEEFMRTDTIVKVDRLGSDFMVNFPNEYNSCEILRIDPPFQPV